MSWELRSFEELSKVQLYNIIKERVNVFVVEQNCPYPELDDLDKNCYHLFDELNNEIRAYCRILPKGLKYTEVSIGRVIVKEQYRRQGLASELVQRAIDFIEMKLDETEIKIQAQDHLRYFYGTFSFQPVSDVYLEDGIPHLDMKRKSQG